MSTSLSADIRELKLFAGLSESEAKELAANCTIHQLTDNETLFCMGDPPDHLYVVQSGCLRLSCPTMDGVEVVVGTADAGGVVGEMALLDPAPRSATATAMGPTQVICLSGATFARLVDTAHPGARFILKQICVDTCTRLRTLDSRVDAVFIAAAPEGQAGTGGILGHLRGLFEALFGARSTGD